MPPKKSPKGQQLHAQLADERRRTEARRQARDQRRAAKLAARRAAAGVPAPGPDVPPAEEPRFWFGFEVPWAKLVAGRVLLFALLAIDAVLAIQHAPRYGAHGAFNVAQLPWLDGLGPDRDQYVLGQLVLAYLFGLVACGVSTRVLLPICAAIYGWLYFGSQLDSYQHHYLVWLLLVIACWVPWQRPVARAGVPVDGRTPVRTWALRLFLIQLGVLYLYAAISKLSHAWLDGAALGQQLAVGSGLRDLIDHTIGIGATAKLVVATELALAATVWIKPAQRFAAPAGILFHIGIIVTGFEIGLFAWIMLAVYAFVIPDGVWAWLGGNGATDAIARAVGAASRGLARTVGYVVGGLGVVAGWLFVGSSRLPHAAALFAISSAGLGLAASHAWRRRARLADLGRACAWIGLAHLIAMLAIFAVDRSSSTAADYYKFWGGASRRLGATAGAIAAYEGWIAIAPDDATPHYQLGRAVLAKDPARGLAELHAAQRLDSSRARAFIEEAKWLQAQGKRAEALAKAQEATYAEPADASAQALVKALTSGGAAAAPPAAGKPDD